MDEQLYLTPWEDRMLTALVDYRYSQKRDTVLISNLKRDEFETSMGNSILSRMVEAGGIIECGWPSFRSPAVRECRCTGLRSIANN